MRRNFYNVNEFNNKLYLHSADAGVAVEIELAPGFATSYPQSDTIADSLGNMLKNAIVKKLTDIQSEFGMSGASVSEIGFDVTTRHFEVQIDGSNIPTDLQLCCFKTKEGPLPNGVSSKGIFQDTHKLFGAIPIDSLSKIGNGSFKKTLETGGVTFTSLLPASLSTMDGVYVRSSLHGGNFHSQSFSRYASDAVSLGESDILAKVPFTSSFFDVDHEYVHYTDSNDTHSITLHQNVLDYFHIHITDANGRRLSEICDTDFNMCLKWEALTYDQIGAPRSAKALPDHSDHDCRLTSRLF